MSESRPQPAFPTQYAPVAVTRHNRALLVAVVGVAVLAIFFNAVGGSGFPYNAPIEQAWCFLLIVDLVGVVVTLGALTVVEQLRRRDPARAALPLDTRRSVFAIVAVSMAAIALVGWGIGGGVEQLVNLLTGVRGRYMYHTGGVVFMGVPWALAAIFGAWGYRPGAHRTTNILALAAIGVWFVLAVIVTIAAIVYGLGGSD